MEDKGEGGGNRGEREVGKEERERGADAYSILTLPDWGLMSTLPRGIVSRVVATQMAMGWPWSLVKGGNEAPCDTGSPATTRVNKLLSGKCKYNIIHNWKWNFIYLTDILENNK